MILLFSAEGEDRIKMQLFQCWTLQVEPQNLPENLSTLLVDTAFVALWNCEVGDISSDVFADFFAEDELPEAPAVSKELMDVVDKFSSVERDIGTGYTNSSTANYDHKRSVVLCDAHDKDKLHAMWMPVTGMSRGAYYETAVSENRPVVFASVSSGL